MARSTRRTSVMLGGLAVVFVTIIIILCVVTKQQGYSDEVSNSCPIHSYTQDITLHFFMSFCRHPTLQELHRSHMEATKCLTSVLSKAILWKAFLSNHYCFQRLSCSLKHFATSLPLVSKTTLKTERLKTSEFALSFFLSLSMLWFVSYTHYVFYSWYN